MYSYAEERHPTLYMGCTLAPSGEYYWTVRLRRRCGLMSNYWPLVSVYSSVAWNISSSVAKQSLLDIFQTTCRLFLLRLRKGSKYQSSCLDVVRSHCLAGRISRKPYVRTSRNFLYVSRMPWLDSRLTTMDYVMYFRFCRWRHFYIMVQIHVQAIGELFTVTRRVAPLGLCDVAN